MEKGLTPDDMLKEDKSLGEQLDAMLKERLIREERKPSLRMSSIGQPCERKFWYEFNRPEASEKFRAEHYLKFLYGDILELFVIWLAKRAGHTVTGEQAELNIRGIKGHRDCVIDGVTVDVKSASSFSFKKFREGLKSADDSFGYLTQLRSYVYAGRDDSTVMDRNRGAFLVIDKTLGHICLDVHEFDFTGIEELYDRRIGISTSTDLPERGFDPVTYGTSGNLELGVVCGYCSFKNLCWPETRTFLYSHKPVHLVKVVREPNVPELKND